jgi:preprotein translocase subunit SecG
METKSILLTLTTDFITYVFVILMIILTFCFLKKKDKNSKGDSLLSSNNLDRRSNS